jgi:hypothetical protein
LSGLVAVWALRRLGDKVALTRWLDRLAEHARKLDVADPRAIQALVEVVEGRAVRLPVPSVKRDLRKRLDSDGMWAALGRSSRPTQRRAAVALGDVTSLRTAIRNGALSLDRPLRLDRLAARLTTLGSAELERTKADVAAMTRQAAEAPWLDLLRHAERDGLLAKALDYLLERHGDSATLLIEVRDLLSSADAEPVTAPATDSEARARALDELRQWIVNNLEERAWLEVLGSIGGSRLRKRVEGLSNYPDQVWTGLLDLDRRGLASFELADELAGATEADTRHITGLLAGLSGKAADDGEPGSAAP